MTLTVRFCHFWQIKYVHLKSIGLARVLSISLNFLWLDQSWDIWSPWLDSPWNTSRLVHVVQWALGHHTKTFPEPINFKISSKCFQIINLFSQYCYLALHLVSPLNIESIMESIRSSFISKGSSPISFSLLFSSTPDLLDLLPLGSIGTSKKKKYKNTLLCKFVPKRHFK